jgi:osmotically-inducible protein OsmY
MTVLTQVVDRLPGFTTIATDSGGGHAYNGTAMTMGNPVRQKGKLRICIAAILVLGLSGCTAMLLGGGNSDGTRLGGDHRAGTRASDDHAVASAVGNRLADDSVLGQYDLRIEAVNGRVILHGTVPSYEARERAIRLAGAVDGVQRVDSRLRIGGT